MSTVNIVLLSIGWFLVIISWSILYDMHINPKNATAVKRDTAVVLSRIALVAFVLSLVYGLYNM